MLAISLLQPWATLAALGLKTNETRSWKTGAQGALAIHASKGKQPAIRELCNSDEHIREALAAHGYTYETLPRGGVIGLVRLEGMAEIVAPGEAIGEGRNKRLDPTTLTPQEQAFGDYTAGRFAWQLSGARALEEVVPCIGQQRLWILPEYVRDQVYAGLHSLVQ